MISLLTIKYIQRTLDIGATWKFFEFRLQLHKGRISLKFAKNTKLVYAVSSLATFMQFLEIVYFVYTLVFCKLNIHQNAIVVGTLAVRFLFSGVQIFCLLAKRDLTLLI